jgi:hypothetical protein
MGRGLKSGLHARFVPSVLSENTEFVAVPTGMTAVVFRNANSLAILQRAGGKLERLFAWGADERNGASNKARSHCGHVGGYGGSAAAVGLWR